MATIWKGSITFGLVNIPVELRPAVRTDRLSFRLLHAEDLSPIAYERVCKADGQTVPWKEIVKGYEYEKGKFIVLTPEDFDAATIESSRTIDIEDFVKEAEIDPRFFDKPYYLVPGKGGEKAYALLREAIRESGSVGIGKVVIREKQHLVAIKTVDDALVLEIMRFAHELADAGNLSFPSAEELRPQELQMARQLIANLDESFQPEKYIDDYQANLMRIIQAKMKGRKIEAKAPPGEPEDTQVIDLMSRLRESIEQGRKGRDAARRGKKPAAASEKKAKGTKGSAKKGGSRSRRRSA